MTKSGVDTGYVAAACLFLGGVALVAGLLATVFAARAIADPVTSVRDGLESVQGGDLEARVDLDPGLLADLRECGLFHDADDRGSYLHLFTEVLGSRVFFEVVQRIGGYEGYGEVNAPIRMAAHRRLRLR